MSYQLGRQRWEKEDLTMVTFPSVRNRNVQVVSRVQLPEYTEELIRYRVEEGVEEEACEWLTAYLLIPSAERFPGPRPGVLALHQCGRDCDVGKESVVGKRVDRPDQAYGRELAMLGFVVLAPDAINCGSRCLHGLRIPGMQPRQWTHGHCWPALNRIVFGGHFRAKRTLDCLRSIDLLESQEDVDSSRLAVVGHSMGSGMAVDAMLCDQRLKAAVLSPGGCSSELRKRLAPRIVLQQQGDMDASPQGLAHADRMQGDMQHAYAGLEERWLYHREPCGHHFSWRFKLLAYRRLQEQFDMLPEVAPIVLKDVAASVVKGLDHDREDLWWSFPNRAADSHLPAVSLQIDGRLRCLAHEDVVRNILELMIVPLLQRVPADSALRIDACTLQDKVHLTMLVDEDAMSIPCAHDFQLREAELAATTCPEAEIHTEPSTGRSRRLVLSLPRIMCLLALLLWGIGCAARNERPKRLEPEGRHVLHGVGQDLPTFHRYAVAAAADGPLPALMNDYVWGDEPAQATIERIRNGYVDREGQKVAGLDSADTPYVALQLGLQFRPVDVIAGRKDAYFKELAIGCAAMDRPVYLRPGYECNGSWNQFSDADAFCRAWRRIATIVRKYGGAQVALVWCIATEGDQRYRRWYPGNEWVDWWAIDLFSPEHLNAAITHEFIDDARAQGFPVMIAECSARWVGAQETARSWDTWFSRFFALVDRHPNIKAFCYIDWDWAQYFPNSSYMRHWGDCRISVNDELFRKWMSKLRTDLFINGGDETALKRVLGVLDVEAVKGCRDE